MRELEQISINKPKKLKSISRFIIGCVLIVAITIGGKIFTTISTTLEGFWIQYQNPYDLHDEFILNKLLTSHRDEIHYLTFGLADKWAEQKHKELIDRVKNKISSDDDAWIEYWYDSEAKFWNHDDKEHATERIPLALKYMELLKNGHSNIVQFDKAGRYILRKELSYYIVSNINNYENSNKEKYSLLEKIITDSEKMYEKIDFDYILTQENGAFVLPIRFLSGNRYALEALIELQISQNKFDCNSFEIRHMEWTIGNIKEVYSKHYSNDNKFNMPNADTILSAIKEDLKNSQNVSEFINKNCHQER